MDNRKAIEQQIIQNVIANTSQITYFGIGGVVRSIITAVAAAIDELYYDLNQTEKKLFIATAEETDLDELAKDYNMVRLGTAAAGVILAFSGTSLTVIPAGTQVKSDSGIYYETLEAITLGDANSPYNLFPCEPIVDKVEAIALTNGEVGNTQANTITTLVGTISGLDSVTNPSPAVNGVDSETDSQFRTRIFERILMLNLGTQKFYNAIVKEINDTILRVYACRGETTREVAVYVANRSGVGLTASQRADLEASLKNYAPICADPKVYNITFTDVDVYIKASFKTGYTITDVFQDLAKNLANYLDWSALDFGVELDDADILSVCRNTDGIKDIDLTLFRPNANIECDANSLPRLGTIYLEDMNDSTSTVNVQPATTYIYTY